MFYHYLLKTSIRQESGKPASAPTIVGSINQSRISNDACVLVGRWHIPLYRIRPWISIPANILTAEDRMEDISHPTFVSPTITTPSTESRPPGRSLRGGPFQNQLPLPSRRRGNNLRAHIAWRVEPETFSRVINTQATHPSSASKRCYNLARLTS